MYSSVNIIKINSQQDLEDVSINMVTYMKEILVQKFNLMDGVYHT